jgi:hypothetical protein
MFRTQAVEKIKTHILCLATFLENRADYEIMWKNIVERGQATDDIMAHALCMLDTQGHKHTVIICNTFCLSTITMVTRRRLSVPLYVYCLSC